jgi:hypothetical protein
MFSRVCLQAWRDLELIFIKWWIGPPHPQPLFPKGGEGSARVLDLPFAEMTSRRWFAAGIRGHTLPPASCRRGNN